MAGERKLGLFHDVSNTGRCICFQLTLTFSKHVFDSRIVLLVVVLVFTKFRSMRKLSQPLAEMYE
jgi:hypothetical protein